MNDGAQSFGARLASAPPAERLALHAAEGNRQEFVEHDRVLASLFDRAIHGEQIIDLRLANRQSESNVVTLKISADDRNALARVLAPEAQQARGGWYVPNSDTALVGTIEFARWATIEPRFSISAASAQRAASVTLDNPDALAIWAALEPVMELLFLPLKLRSGYWLGSRRPDQMEKDWATVDATYAALAIDPGPLEVFKDGRRWATLSIDGVLAAREALLDAWSSSSSNVGARAIVLLISLLVDRYYQKARDGKAQRTKVINKSLERVLSGAFGGDWLAFVRYLGEEVHPAEQIATAVEATSLLVSGRDRATQAATTTGVPVGEIERMLAAYWGGHDDSPVEARAQVMRDWWHCFDDLHNRQAPGMPSLWGLLADRFEDGGWNPEDDRYNRDAYRMFPAELNARIEEHWATAVLPRWPEALVSEPYPHASFAETLGPGIAFWHDVSLTCWFVCEGPYSRIDIAEMPDYYERQIVALERLGCPIDTRLFADLRNAEEKLTDRPLEFRDDSRLGTQLGVEIRISEGQKKDGFEHLRAVVTSYRRTWAGQHLETYLQRRWEQDLRAVGDSYHRQVADKGKPPTLKQFAKLAEGAANHWFGGDLVQLAGALKLPAPDPQERRRLLPADRGAFVARVRELLGGQRWDDSPADMDREERARLLRRSELADRAPKVVQIWEATGDVPPLKSASWARSYLETAFGSDTEAGWETLLSAVKQALHELDGPQLITASELLQTRSSNPEI